MYQAIIAAVKVRPHPNADRIQLGTCAGHQVIVGLDTQDGEVGIFFPPDGQLSLEYCEANNLLKSAGGYFDEKRRVKAQGFRGQKSEGLWMPLKSLHYLVEYPDDLEDLPLGKELISVNGYKICQRYETPATKRKAQGTQQQRPPRVQDIYFKKHIDTSQWRFYKDSIPDNAFISITEKLHGTSGRYGRVLVQQPKKVWQRVLSLFGIRTAPTFAYEYMVGTRNTVLDNSRLAAGTSYYGNEQFRFDAVRGIELYEGEVLYFELVGYTSTGSLIMPAHDTSKDKELWKKYNTHSMAYTYGQQFGKCGLYVYRITRTNEKGITTELSWNQVKQRCNELGLKYCPEYTVFMHDNGIDIGAQVEAWLEGPSDLDPSHIREGVIVRVESEFGTQWYKDKSFTFKVLEGIIKDQDDYVDTEEAS